MQRSRIIRRPELQYLTGLSYSTIHRRLKDPHSNFPRPVKLGQHSVGWRENEVMAYLAELPATERPPVELED